MAWSKWRVFSALAGLSLLIFGGKCLLDARRLADRFAQWEIAKPVDMVVDLSAPGEFTAPFHQTCSSAHSEDVALRIPAELLQGENLKQSLVGLDARLEIFENSGTNVLETAVLGSLEEISITNGVIPLFSLSSFRKGEYRARLIVIQGAPALQGVVQRLEGRYLLCGMEAMPAVIGRILGIASSVIGGIVFVVAFRALTRGRNVGQPIVDDVTV